MTRRKVLALREPNGRIPSLREAIDGDSTAVYVIAKGNAEVKIGVSKNVANRSLGLQTSNSAELNVFWAVRLERADAFRLEKHIHKKLRQTLSHLRGEWYALSPETAVEIVRSAAKKLQFKTEVDLRFGLGVAA